MTRLDRPAPPAFTALPDLASRALGAAVVWASDEFFAEKENLIKPEPPVFNPSTFTHKGQQYDGWETRRRRPGAPGTDGTAHDSAVIRLATPGVIHGVTVDTAFFLGNHPPRCSLEAAWCEGYPAPAELADAEWTTIVAPYPLRGGEPHDIAVSGPQRRFTHVRLNMLPDGGIARLRVYGEPVPDPRYFDGLTVDLAALRDGARGIGCSDMFYNRPDNLLLPGLARDMGGGWENARRRDDGNDWVEIALLAEGLVDVLELDTTHFKGNAPDRAGVRAARMGSGERPRGADWVQLFPVTRLQPDTPHRFPIRSREPATHLRLDVYPDGGLSRLRAWGVLTPDGLAALTSRWRLTG
jgi:allantoicase